MPDEQQLVSEAWRLGRALSRLRAGREYDKRLMRIYSKAVRRIHRRQIALLKAMEV